jgi:hypothetical protein
MKLASELYASQLLFCIDRCQMYFEILNGGKKSFSLKGSLVKSLENLFQGTKGKNLGK